MSKNSAARQKWQPVLQSHGLRTTHAIITTLMCLDGAIEALSHDEMTSRLAENAPDRVTLYRILERLLHAGIVQRFTDSARTQRYSLCASSPVGSFECDCCHLLIPLVMDPALENALQLVKARLSAQGMDERTITLTSYGLCPDCKHT